MGKFTYRGSLIITLFLILLGMLATMLPIQAEAAGKIVVTGKYVNVRSSANITSTTLSKVYQGETYQVIKESGGWYYIGLKSGQEGWVAGWLVKTVVTPVTNTKATTPVSTNKSQSVKVTVFPFQAKIIGSIVNLRERNTLSAKVLNKLTLGTKVTVLSKQAKLNQNQNAE